MEGLTIDSCGAPIVQVDVQFDNGSIFICDDEMVSILDGNQTVHIHIDTLRSAIETYDNIGLEEEWD
jgi:hypothetical protein